MIIDNLKNVKIPFLSIPDTAITSSSQAHLPISDIIDDVILYKDGGAAIVMESTSLNFGLLSEREQEAVIGAYAALLNSLSFSMQIMIRTQRKDISVYLKFIDAAAQKIVSPKLAYLMQGYRRFITESIKKKNVLGKKFYIVIPFSPLELGVAKSIKTSINVVKKAGPLPFPKSYVLKKAKIILYPRRDHLVRQAGRLGLKLRQLTKPSLIQLYFDIYNPVTPAVKKEEGVAVQ
jgi:hypothetical protein